MTPRLLLSLAAIVTLASAPASAQPARRSTKPSASKPSKALRPAVKVDPEAMAEAISSHRDSEKGFSSSASYAHFLKSRIAHHAGNHRGAVHELLLALATDDGNPYLLTALAEEYARLSELGRAESTLRRVVERHPKHYAAQVLMGRILMDGGKAARAEAHLRRAIKLRPSDPEAYLVLAQLELDRGRFDAAIKTVEALSAAVPGEAIGYRRLGFVFAERGEHAHAEALLLKAVERDPGDFESWVTLAQVYVQTNRLEDAEGAYARALERDPDNREVLLNAGRLALKNQSLVRARAYFDRLLGLSQDPQMVVQVAFSFLAAREMDAAAQALEIARDARAEEPRLAFYAGLVNERMRRLDKAAAAFGEVPPDSELFHEARLHQASALSALGEHPRALELLRAALRERPEYGALYPGFARALERAGDSAAAEQFLTATLEKRKTPQLYEALSRHYARRGRFDDAVKTVRDGLKIFAKDESLLFTLGATYERKGDFERSVSAMREVLSVNPDSAMALNYLGYILADKGRDLDAAEKLLNRAVELKPDSGEYLDSLGWLHYRKGNHPHAVKLLEKAAELSPQEPVILEHLGDAYLALSRLSDAAEQYRKALEALIHADDEEVDRTALQSKLERKLKKMSGSR